MPAIYVALTHNLDPPQMEFLPTDSTQKYPKITRESLIFKLAERSMLNECKEAASARGFGLHRITLRDITTGHSKQAPRCNATDEFCARLNMTGWCNRCRQFTYGTFMKGRCWKCKRPTT